MNEQTEEEESFTFFLAQETKFQEMRRKKCYLILYFTCVCETPSNAKTFRQTKIFIYIEYLLR